MTLLFDVGMVLAVIGLCAIWYLVGYLDGENKGIEIGRALARFDARYEKEITSSEGIKGSGLSTPSEPKEQPT